MDQRRATDESVFNRNEICFNSELKIEMQVTFWHRGRFGLIFPSFLLLMLIFSLYYFTLIVIMHNKIEKSMDLHLRTIQRQKKGMVIRARKKKLQLVELSL